MSARIGLARGVGHGAMLMGHAGKWGAGSDLRDDWAAAWLARALARAAHKWERRESGKKRACGVTQGRSVGRG